MRIENSDPQYAQSTVVFVVGQGTPKELKI